MSEALSLVTAIEPRPLVSAPLVASAYGVVGDGITDDTVALQAALTAGAQANLVVHGRNAVCKITGPLTMGGPGLVFDAVPHGSAGGPGLSVTGTGYTALTVGPQAIVTEFRVAIYGTGNAANGLLLLNPLLGRFGQIRVYGLAGFGVQIEKCWDCVFDTISVERCGTPTAYAFSLQDAGDCCNCSVFHRVQVERAQTLAISISPGTLMCTFGVIHSEQLQAPDAAQWGWHFGANQCHYLGMRLTSEAPDTQAKVWFDAAYSTFALVRLEGGIPAQVTAWNGSGITFVSPMMGTVYEQLNQTGKITVLGGRITGWTGNTSNRTLYNTRTV